MRTPSEYIRRAVEGARTRLMPDCAVIMRHRGYEADVVRIGAHARRDSEPVDYANTEGAKVLALSSDFPEIRRGDVVELGDERRAVIEARSDPTRTSLTVSLSETYEDFSCAFSGDRRTGRIRCTVRASILFRAVDEAFDEASSSSDRRIIQALVPKDGDGSVPQRPQLGDELRLIDGRAFRVTSVDEPMGSNWRLEARQS